MRFFNAPKLAKKCLQQKIRISRLCYISGPVFQMKLVRSNEVFNNQIHKLNFEISAIIIEITRYEMEK